MKRSDKILKIIEGKIESPYNLIVLPFIKKLDSIDKDKWNILMDDLIDQIKALKEE